MFATARDRQAIRVNGTSASGSRSRPVIRRTASTADVDDSGKELNTVAFVDQHRVIDAGDISADEDGGFGVGRIAKGQLGTQDDWESDSSNASTGQCPKFRARHSTWESQTSDDPFGRQRTPPMSTSRGASRSLSDHHEDDMQMDSPVSSPIAAARQRQQQARKSSQKRKRQETTNSSDEDAGVSDRVQNFADDADNPFLAKPTASVGGQKAKLPSATKASYLFRGKRITYEAPITSIFPAADSDDEELNRRIGAKSGPRVLFPSHPPTPPSSTMPPAQITPPAMSRMVQVMQTPARSGRVKPSAFVTPALPLSADTEADKDCKPTNKARRHDVIPPTPASLPQTKPDPANRPQLDDARSQLERERLNDAIQSLQNSAARQNYKRVADGKNQISRNSAWRPTGGLR